MIQKLIDLFKSKTPKIAQFLQALSVAVAAIPTYYESLPPNFQATIPTEWLKYIAVIGGLCLFLLQFTTVKKKSDE